MKELDDLLDRYNNLGTPVYVKGKAYPGHNPYILNKINNLLLSGELKAEDIAFDENKIELNEMEGVMEYLYYPALEHVSMDIDNEYNEIRDRQRAGDGSDG